MTIYPAKINSGPVDDPAIYRPLKGRLRVRVAVGTTGAWIREACHAPNSQPFRDGHIWLIAQPYLRPLAEAMAARFGFCDVLIDFRKTKRCDTRCVAALGNQCDCACLGQNHGGGLYSDWLLVGETTLVSKEIVRAHYRLNSKGQVSTT